MDSAPIWFMGFFFGVSILFILMDIKQRLSEMRNSLNSISRRAEPVEEKVSDNELCRRFRIELEMAQQRRRM